MGYNLALRMGLGAWFGGWVWACLREGGVSFSSRIPLSGGLPSTEHLLRNLLIHISRERLSIWR